MSDYIKGVFNLIGEYLSDKGISPYGVKTPRKRTKKFYYFEVLWYKGRNEKEALENDFEYIEFPDRKEAMSYYKKHRKDKNKFGWLVTKRNEWGEIIEDIII